LGHTGCEFKFFFSLTGRCGQTGAGPDPDWGVTRHGPPTVHRASNNVHTEIGKQQTFFCFNAGPQVRKPVDIAGGNILSGFDATMVSIDGIARVEGAIFGVLKEQGDVFVDVFDLDEDQKKIESLWDRWF
jgi:hypothetical protein